MKFIGAFLLAILVSLQSIAQDKIVTIIVRNEILEIEEIQAALSESDYALYYIPNKPHVKITFKNPTSKTKKLIKFLRANYGVGTKAEPGDHPTTCEGDND